MSRTVAPFGARLLGWYRPADRDLPWRGIDDAWGVWVSEVMLQQTRVEVVRDAWPRFMARYPTPATLAAASDDEMHAAWRGLGYYRRARFLRDGARQVVARHGGKVPRDVEALHSLAGIGDYTCGAIASIAFGIAVPAVDGNVERVFARHRGIDDDVRTARGRKAIRSAVVAALETERPGDFNQALMDLGATVCTPRNPDCPRCPVAVDCVARRDGRQTQLPRLPERRAAVPVASKAVLVAAAGGKILGARVPEGEVNAGQIELPGPGVLIDHPDDRDVLAHSLAQRYGAGFAVGEALCTIRHGITHHRIALTVHEAELHGPRGALLRGYHPDDESVPWTTPSRKALAKWKR